MKHSMSPAAVHFGARVRRVRVDLGLSQESIAELAQMHVTNYGKIERGIANPSLVTMLRIASVLGTDVALLTEGLSRDDLPDELEVLSADEFLQERERRRKRQH
jgi:transcriptional regulator with XRE-family HTH domain